MAEETSTLCWYVAEILCVWWKRDLGVSIKLVHCSLEEEEEEDYICPARGVVKRIGNGDLGLSMALVHWAGVSRHGWNVWLNVVKCR